MLNLGFDNFFPLPYRCFSFSYAILLVRLYNGLKKVRLSVWNSGILFLSCWNVLLNESMMKFVFALMSWYIGRYCLYKEKTVYYTGIGTCKFIRSMTWTFCYHVIENETFLLKNLFTWDIACFYIIVCFFLCSVVVTIYTNIFKRTCTSTSTCCIDR